MLSWEKPLVKPMAPGSIFYHISFQSTFILHLYYKIPKIYLSYHTISIRSHFRKWPWRDWQPLYCVGCEFFVCLCRCVGLLRSLLLDWYLGSQKLREILTLLCCITLSSSRENQRSAQEVARRISGAVAGESTQKSTYQVPITNPYLPHYIICHLPLVFLSPTSPLPFYSPSLSICLFLPDCFLFACELVFLLVTMARDNTKLCDFTNTNNNDFISTPIAPLTDAKSCEINTALLNLVMKDQFSGLPSEDASTHLNNFVDFWYAK